MSITASGGASIPTFDFVTCDFFSFVVEINWKKGQVIFSRENVEGKVQNFYSVQHWIPKIVKTFLGSFV